MKEYYVYKHIRLDTNTVFYIGKGKGNRAYQTAGRSDLWQKTSNKSGYIVEIITKDLSEDDAFELEEFLILEYGRRVLKTGSLVNITNGGEGTSGHIMSKESKRKMSESAKKRGYSQSAIDSMVKRNIGKKRSEETKRKIGQANSGSKGFKHSLESKGLISESQHKRIKSISPNGKIETWNSIKECAATLFPDATRAAAAISMVCRKINKTSRNYKFKFL